MSAPYLTLLAARAAETEGSKYIQPGGIAFNLTALLVGLLLGGLLACILAVLFHAVIGRFFRTLISFRAFTREGSRTLAELGFSKNFMLRRALRSRHSLVRKLVTVVLPDGTVLPPLHSADDDLADREAAASAIHAEDHPIVSAEEGKDTAEAAAAREDAPIAEAPGATRRRHLLPGRSPPPPRRDPLLGPRERCPLPDPRRDPVRHSGGYPAALPPLLCGAA